MDITLNVLERLIAERSFSKPEGSHTIKLLNDGPSHWAKKIGEEAIELGIEIVRKDTDRIVAEATDLIYNLVIALHGSNVTLADIERELTLRHLQKTGCPKLDRKGT